MWPFAYALLKYVRMDEITHEEDVIGRGLRVDERLRFPIIIPISNIDVTNLTGPN